MTQPTITAADRQARDWTPAELRHRRIPGGFGGRCEQCPECGELFSCTSVGDMHRYGPYTARRCYSRAEMTERGMHTDDRDVWHGPGPAEITPLVRPRTAEQGEGVPPLGSGPERPSDFDAAGSGGAR